MASTNRLIASPGNSQIHHWLVDVYKRQIVDAENIQYNALKNGQVKEYHFVNRV